MNRKFWQGLVAGLSLAIMLMFITFGVYLMIEAVTKSDNKEDKLSAQEDSHISVDPWDSMNGGGWTVPIHNNNNKEDEKKTEEVNTQADIIVDEEKKAEETAEAKLFEDKLNYVLQTIKTRYYNDVDDSVLYDAMLRGLLGSLNDPYSCYFSPDELKALMETTSGEYCGVGMLVSQNYETMEMVVISPLSNSPAFEAGILPGDIVIGVNGESVVGMDINLVVGLMKGEEGTPVDVTIRRGGEEITFNIIRRKIEYTYVSYEMLDNDIAHIVISEFYEKTADQFDRCLAELEQKGMKGLIIDLRGNPGGLYDSVVACLDRILEKGKLLVYTEDKYGFREEEYSKDDEALDIPMVILIDGKSASASEIFTITLQEYGKATVVGTQSFGKGIVQSLFPIYYDNSAIKVTISRYFSPNGVCIHGTGVTPDIVVELPQEQAQQLLSIREKDDQLDKAVEVLLDKMK